ncbi:RNA polymerase factor sigma-54 [Magnetospira sp. QH-2]|uniref:RNA polymerase factor sigma-54 n=1 Tax=Magnetospira sp. (strain QH-2) TaxID=1288970 RepID=UPI0003E81A75|nr:RNA polymerase factor sigma-54 [Magnetospira sp. QH-2]CCQ75134.1 RNA polymerase sigma-54 factor [Magnetospira sp. QH-2]
MALNVRLDIRQAQTLVMTPQLQQAIKLLQMNNLELSSFVEQEIERNPLLEVEEERPYSEETPSDAPEPVEDAPNLSEVDTVAGQDFAEESGTALDVDYDNTFNNDSPGDQVEAGMAAGGGEAFDSWGNGGSSDFSDPTGDLERTLAESKTLRDHLIQQINMELGDTVMRMVALHLLDHLDASGYMRADLDEIAETLGCDVDLIHRTLAQVQQFDPTGIFARDLGECLALQLREQNRLDPAIQALLDNLEMLARHDIPGLLRVCDVDQEDLADMIGEIRRLDPKPALSYSDEGLAQPVTPDILMRAGPGGDWIIELNPDTLPRVLVNNAYHATVSRQASDQDSKKYIAECFQTANWLVKALHQRATTILKVSSELVGQQDAFFSKGVGYLKPLILRDIAEAIEMHESTVSRVTSNKFIATPRGIYELKFFFTTAIASADGGEAHSSEAVRHRIKALIDEENPKKVLSDDKIVEHLRAEGIDIARRTVAKYREAMKIPSSVDRRRQKKMQLNGG